MTAMTETVNTAPAATILSQAEDYCRRQGIRLTSGRRDILTAVAASEEAVKAYDLLKKVTRPGNKAMPPTVYRALDFWIDHGFIHRIESLNAFVACSHPPKSQGCQMLICTQCHAVVEVCSTRVRNLFEKTAEDHNFTYDHSVLEIYGRCAACRATNAS